MEQLAPPTFNPHLKRVLKSYQSVALNSLSGPSSYSQAWGPVSVASAVAKVGSLVDLDCEYRKALLNGPLHLNTNPSSPVQQGKSPVDQQHHLAQVTDKQGKLEQFVSHSPPFPAGSLQPPHQQGSAQVQQQTAPLFLPMDSNPGIRSQTILEGYTITCFIVGGEKRLCLPQILNSVLRDFSLDQINAICDELHIFCSRCNPEQLHIMREKGDLPQTAASCGLITKTDAERLCNALLHGVPEKCKDPPSPSSFKVYHECFGKCKGLFDPVLYKTPYDKCIECLDCHGMFAPQKFVCHSHKSLENRTCHWGFDSANWRHYLLLSKDQENKERLQELLDQVKAKFDYKRKQCDNEGLDSKRSRYNENAPTPTTKLETPPTTWADASQFRSMSAFRPWSPSLLNILKEAKVPGIYRDGMQRVLPPYLHTGPPVLLNPERVIPHSDTSRYEPHFAPNVSLAPACQQKCKEEEGEEERPKPQTQVVCKTEDNFDIEVSSDTENSSLRSTDSSVPTTPRDDHRHQLTSPLVDGVGEREQQLDMLRRVLEGKLPDSVDMKEHYLEEFMRIQRRQEERWHILLKAHKDLQQELEYVKITKKERLRESSEAKRTLRKELEIQKEQHTTQVKELQLENQRLRQDLEATHGRQADVTQVREKYRRRVDTLRSRLHQSDHENLQLRKQVAMLHEEFKKLGKEPPEFIASPPPPYPQNHSSPNHRRESADSEKSHESHENHPAVNSEEVRS